MISFRRNFRLNISQLSFFGKLTGLVLCFALSMSSLQAQDIVFVYGSMKDYMTSRKIPNGSVVVYKNGSKLTDIPANASGKYEANLDYGAKYRLQWIADGYVEKNIEIDTRNVPEEDRLGGHGMNVDITLLTELPGVDFTLMKEPFGKSTFSGDENSFAWDHEYTEKMKSAQVKLLKDYENQLKNADKLEEQYNKAIAAGDQAMSQKNYKKAVASYNDALSARPGDDVAKAKLSDAEIGLEQEGAAAELEKQYTDLIKNADDLFKKGEFESAKGKYKEALTFKEEELYPKTQIKACEAKIKELAEQAEKERLAQELQEKFDAAIKAGDDAFKTDDLDNAEKSYQEAAKLKPEEVLPKTKLDQVKNRRAELEAEAAEAQKAKELEDNYNAAIAAADAAFDGEKYEEAKSKYNEALGLKPDEKHPKDRLGEIEIRLADLAKKEEEERLAKELREKFDALIIAADASFKGEEYEAATSKYSEALGLLPDEQYPKDQLEAIKGKLDEQAKAQEEAERMAQLKADYDAAISLADEAFKSNDLDKATGGYEKALELLPDENYPKDQLEAIKLKRDELAKQKEEEERQKKLQADYDKAITAADKAFDKENWQDAQGSYKAAKELKPEETYPDTKLEEIKAKLDALAAEEAEKKRLEELQKQYDDAIAAADGAFDKQEWEIALNAYKDAQGLKPEESYPQSRIDEVLGKMDAAAKEAAEEERKKREAEELEARYRDLINSGDQAFEQSNWADAKIAYTDALEVKPGEKHPSDRLAEIESKLAADAEAAEAARLAAEQAEKDRLAAEAAAQAEAERLAAEQAEKDRLAAEAEAARIAAEKARQDSLAALNNALQAQFDEKVMKADKAFESDKLDKASDLYNEALELIAAAPHPTNRLKEIQDIKSQREAAVADAAREAEAARKAEEERLRKEREAAEAAKRAEEEAAQRKLAAKEKRKQFDRLVLDADKAYAEEEYSAARALYSQAYDMIPDEVYPPAQIEKIDMFLGELERKKQEAEAARLAAEEAELRRKEELAARRIKSGESDAERFMREAREREEAEKYERIKRLKESVQTSNEEWASAADGRLEGSINEQSALESNQAGLYKGSEEGRLTRVEEIARLKEVLKKEAEEKNAEDKASSEEAQALKDSREQELSATSAKWNAAGNDRAQNSEAEKKKHSDKLRMTANAQIERNDAGADKAEAHAEFVKELDASADGRSYDALASVTSLKEDLQKTEEERKQSAEERSKGASSSSELLKQQGAALAESGKSKADNAFEQSKIRKEKLAAAEKMRSSSSKKLREAERDKLSSQRLNQRRDTKDYSQNELAKTYPQGVTEESYSEGNKVIIRRVVVVDNKADEYNKVIAKWGTFYFKNGQSISQTIWNNETSSD